MAFGIVWKKELDMLDLKETIKEFEAMDTLSQEELIRKKYAEYCLTRLKQNKDEQTNSAHGRGMV